MSNLKIAKIYRKIVSAKSSYQAYSIAERLSPEQAKEVLLSFIINTSHK